MRILRIFQFQKQRAVDFFLEKILAFQSPLQTTKEIRDMILSPKKKENEGFYYLKGDKLFGFLRKNFKMIENGFEKALTNGVVLFFV